MGRLIDEKDLLDLLKNEEWRLDEVNTVENFKEIIDKVPTACSEFGSAEELREAKEIHNIAYRQYAYLQKDKEIFEKIEKALGFRLYSWQQSYIYTGHFRRIGSTTAKCLKRLLFSDSPIDFSERPRNAKEDCERMQMYKIYNVLHDAGIATNPILRNQKEKESYMRTLLKEGRLNNLRFETENEKPGEGIYNMSRGDLLHNASGYRDPTAYEAIKNASRERKNGGKEMTAANKIDISQMKEYEITIAKCGVPFQSGYLCMGICEKQLEFEYLDKSKIN